MEEKIDPALEVALAKYEVIAPLVCRPLARGEQCNILDEMAGKLHDYPGGKRTFHRRTIERWASRYLSCAAEGRMGKIQALMPTPRADKGVPRVILPDVIERAVQLRLEDPSRSTEMLLTLLGIADIKEPTLAYHLRNRGVTRRDLSRDSRAYPRYEHKARNDCWQGDFSTGIWLPDPCDPKKVKRSHLHLFIDDHTRYPVHGEFYFKENLPCLEDALRKAILKGGIPSIVYVDQGAVYRARQIRLLAARIGFQLVLATPFSPQGKGKVERSFGSIKSRFYPEAERSGLTTLEELNQFFWAWLDSCYLDRVHGETGETPRQRWEAGEQNVRYLDPEKLPEIFLWEESRQVRKTGTVPLCGNLYPLPEEMVGKTVRLLYDPFDLSRVRAYYQDRFLGTFEPYQLNERTSSKATPAEKKQTSPRSSSVEFRGRLMRAWNAHMDDTTVRLDTQGAGTYLTCPEFITVVGTAIERPLSGGELSRIRDFFYAMAPLAREGVTRVLSLAVQDKGTDRHLRFYLDAIRQAKMNREVL
jgi:transposase InsO family protein